MVKRKIHLGVLLFLSIALLFLYVYPAHAADELYLTGFVKSVDPKINTVVVDVKSSPCEGLRTFTADNAAELDDFVDQKVTFMIDSATCKKDDVYKMFTVRRVKK